jgi:hypothetical protein
MEREKRRDQCWNRAKYLDWRNKRFLQLCHFILCSFPLCLRPILLMYQRTSDRSMSIEATVAEKWGWRDSAPENSLPCSPLHAILSQLNGVHIHKILSCRFVSVATSHLQLYFPSCLFPLRSIINTYPVNDILFHLISLTILHENWEYAEGFCLLVGWNFWYCGHYWPIVPAPDDRWWWL